MVLVRADDTGVGTDGVSRATLVSGGAASGIGHGDLALTVRCDSTQSKLDTPRLQPHPLPGWTPVTCVVQDEGRPSVPKCRSRSLGKNFLILVRRHRGAQLRPHHMHFKGQMAWNLWPIVRIWESLDPRIWGPISPANKNSYSSYP